MSDRFFEQPILNSPYAFPAQLQTAIEAHTQQNENGIEYWLAIEMQHLLAYSECRNFTLAINKAKTAGDVSGHYILDHFVDVNKMTGLGKGDTHEIEKWKKPWCGFN